MVVRPAPVEVVDSEISTITAAADRVLLVREPRPWVLHVELQASRDPDLAYSVPAYNALLRRRHRAHVRSVLVLLRRQAETPGVTGLIEEGFDGEPPDFALRFRLIRVWELPVERLLAGGLGMLPLAPLAANEADLPAVIRRMDARLQAETSVGEAGALWTAADVLMGLIYPRDFVTRLLQGVPGMKESTTYQAILEEGAVDAAQSVLLRQGRKKFGQPPAGVEMAVRAIQDVARLQDLCERLLDAESWNELLPPN